MRSSPCIAYATVVTALIVSPCLACYHPNSTAYLSLTLPPAPQAVAALHFSSARALLLDAWAYLRTFTADERFADVSCE